MMQVSAAAPQAACRRSSATRSAAAAAAPRNHRSTRLAAVVQHRRSSSLPTRLVDPQAQPMAEEAQRLPLLSLVASSVAIDAQTQRFEQLAGRAAMIGVFVALVAELLTEQPLFFASLSADTTTTLGGVFAAAVATAAAAAASSRRRIGLDLLEAVVTSLTAVQRSAASVTGREVDGAVDSVLQTAFSRGVICSLLAGEAEDDDDEAADICSL